MTPSFVIAYVGAFVAGPILYGLMMRMTSGRKWAIALLAAFGIACVILAAWALLTATPVFGFEAPLVALAAMWLAWVSTLAITVSTMWTWMASGKSRRVLYITGLLATTLPWFGLATARMMMAA